MRWGTAPTVFVVLAGLLGGCDRPPGPSESVVGVFGEVGLGPGAFSYPRAIAVGPTGAVFVVDKAGRVQRFSARGSFETEWRMPETRQGKPVGLTVHRDGRVFVADTHYHRVLVFDRSGTLLDSFGRAGTGDGEFGLPTDIAIDATGFVYVSEYGGNDRITKWSPDLRFVRTIAKGPIEGRRLRRPAGMAIDEEQTLWVADACNHRIVRLSLDGAVLTTFGRMGRGTGELRYPYGIDVNRDGTIMVCEYGGDRLQWFSKQGQSLGTWGRSGRAPGELSGPWGAAYGPGGQVYVVDSLNSRVQIVEP